MIRIVMKSVLMVAEKPSLAASLATILSNGRSSSRKGIYSIKLYDISKWSIENIATEFPLCKLIVRFKQCVFGA